MSFASLKKSSFQDLLSKAENLNKSEAKGPDERLWKPEVDKAGNGYAVIRFLPAPDGEDLPWAQVWTHAFQGPGGWYIENSLTTVGKKDPVSDLNRELWNSGGEGSPQRTQARNQKRKLNYYSNIYVVKDSANPENEGKVFLYRYGKKIFDKIMESMQPAFEDETPVNPFDFWKGADFKLKITKVAGFWNYDKSEFDAPSTLGDLKDKELEALWKQEYSLSAFTADDQFKSYDELRERLERTLKGGYNKPVDESLEDESEGRGAYEQRVPSPTQIKTDPYLQIADKKESQGDDDTLSYFAKLANED